MMALKESLVIGFAQCHLVFYLQPIGAGQVALAVLSAGVFLRPDQTQAGGQDRQRYKKLSDIGRFRLRLAIPLQLLSSRVLLSPA
jgi:hypothetical protein